MLFSNARLIRYLKIKLERGVSITQDDWFTILDAFRNLSSLIVRIDSCRNLLTVLRRDPSRWPRLRRLSISCKNGSGVHECLLSVVENRSREGLRLKSLAFSGHGKKLPVSEHRMRRLQGLVREVTMVDELKL
ncbi:hypothetical protein L226DRAFT_397637 [Lentinus tigrinus ALCF2SS1-7]|nr:hypothetical protein L226DRAFT_397637 [Lentinus tigrinus ALCF2SS1-7]